MSRYSPNVLPDAGPDWGADLVDAFRRRGEERHVRKREALADKRYSEQRATETSRYDETTRRAQAQTELENAMRGIVTDPGTAPPSEGARKAAADPNRGNYSQAQQGGGYLESGAYNPAVGGFNPPGSNERFRPLTNGMALDRSVADPDYRARQSREALTASLAHDLAGTELAPYASIIALNPQALDDVTRMLHPSTAREHIDPLSAEGVRAQLTIERGKEAAGEQGARRKDLGLTVSSLDRAVDDATGRAGAARKAIPEEPLPAGDDGEDLDRYNRDLHGRNQARAAAERLGATADSLSNARVRAIGELQSSLHTAPTQEPFETRAQRLREQLYGPRRNLTTAERRVLADKLRAEGYEFTD